MYIYSNACEEIPTLPGAHDPSDVLDYTIYYSASDWSSSTPYKVDDIVYPTTRQGIYLLCVQPGISDSSEPTWNTKNKSKNTDNTVIWKTMNDELALEPTEEVSTSDWKSDAPMIFTHGGITGTLSVGDLVTGDTSGATGYVERVVTDTEIYIQNITGTFSSGEIVYETLSTNYVTIADAGTDTITLDNLFSNTISCTVFIGPVSTDIEEVVVSNTMTTNSAPTRTIERSFRLKIEER